MEASPLGFPPSLCNLFPFLPSFITLHFWVLSYTPSLFVLVDSSHSSPPSYFCFSPPALQTDGRSWGHGEVSGWGDGLQGGGAVFLNPSSRGAFLLSFASAAFSSSSSSSPHCPEHVLSLPDVHTYSGVLSFPAAFQRCEHAKRVCRCVCLLTELGFVEKQPPEYDGEQIGV